MSKVPWSAKDVPISLFSGKGRPQLLDGGIQVRGAGASGNLEHIRSRTGADLRHDGVERGSVVPAGDDTRARLETGRQWSHSQGTIIAERRDSEPTGRRLAMHGRP